MEPIDSTNPFASPLAGESTRYPVDSDVEATRREYLSHEASVQSMGLLYLLGGFFSGLIGVLFMVGFFVGASATQAPAVAMLIGVLALALIVAMTILQLWVGFALRKLDPRARTPATVLSAIGLLGFPIGTLINAYFLWLLQSKKGAVVFSPEYREVIEQTPHIKYKTSIIVWIFLALLLILVLFAIVGVLTSPPTRWN